MESSYLTPVAPTRPAAPYIGGKRYLAARIIQRIEATPHRSYAEVFVGMGGVFLRRSSRPRAEAINDWSRDISGFYRVLQNHYVAFLDMLRFQITTRAEFERLMRVDPDTLTDLQRAARFLYLQRTAYGGKVKGRNFGMTPDRSARFNVTELASLLEDIHERMAGVVIERMPWADFIRRYDTPSTLFYLDPPYWGSEDDYGADLFGRDEFSEMARILGALKGNFILSLNDCAGVRETFAAFPIEAVKTKYGIAGKGAATAGEVIITGGARAAPV